MPLLLRDRAALRPPVALLTTAEARALGIPVSHAGSRYARIRRGVYADARAVAALKPWEHYALRVHAFVLTHPGAVLCLESAAVLLGLPLFGECRDIHVYDPDRAASRRFGDVCVHTSADARTVVDIGGILVTSLLDTVCDLIRVLPPAQGLAVADAAISPAQGGPLRIDAIRDHATAQVGRRGTDNLEWVSNRADPRSESPGEALSRAVIEWSGFETPELQVTFIYEGVRDRTDFEFPSTRSLGESDGWGKYDLDDPAAAAQHLRNEKRREDRLRRGGHPFARWETLDAQRVDPMCRALVQAAVRIVRPRDLGRLATLRRSPRQLPAARRPAESSDPSAEKPQRR